MLIRAIPLLLDSLLLPSLRPLETFFAISLWKTSYIVNDWYFLKNIFGFKSSTNTSALDEPFGG